MNTISPHTFEGQEVIRGHVADYVKNNGVTSLRKIASYVNGKTGLTVSASTIGRLLRKMKIADRPKVQWEEK